MPLAKKRKGSKQNQGAQWGDTGSAGNIKHKSSEEVAAGPGKGRVVNRKGRNVSIGRHKGVRRKDVNPE